MSHLYLMANFSNTLSRYPQKVQGIKQRLRSAKFQEHYNQAQLFYNSLTPHEQAHLVAALSFELSHCDDPQVYETYSKLLNNIDFKLIVSKEFHYEWFVPNFDGVMLGILSSNSALPSFHRTGTSTSTPTSIIMSSVRINCVQALMPLAGQGLFCAPCRCCQTLRLSVTSSKEHQ